MIKVKHTLLVLMAILLGATLTTGVSAADEPKSETIESVVNFTFNPTLTMSLSDADIVISDLVPGAVKNSNEIEIRVGTNNIAGYLLYATVGNEQNASRDLTHAEGASLFSSIDVGATLAELSTDSTWGYSTDSGTSFSGLPLYSATGAELNSSDGAADETTKFLIGAKAAVGQIAGDYSNVINFFAVTNVLLDDAELESSIEYRDDA